MAQIESLTSEQIDELVTRALEEDIGSGDITTQSVIEDDFIATGLVTAKEQLVLCGLDIFHAIFKRLDPHAAFPQSTFKDGDLVPGNADFIQVQAKVSALLTGEHAALNILQRLSGIATLTREFVDAANPVTILDTRKTTPGMRIFEKYAVKCGGGQNHRFGLFDAVLIKDNHIKLAGGIASAIKRVRGSFNGPIEVEVTNLNEVREALALEAEIILLDNMSLESLKEAVSLIDGKSKIEVSGCITLERLETLRSLSIDFVSAGQLTHSAPAVDISMNLV